MTATHYDTYLQIERLPNSGKKMQKQRHGERGQRGWTEQRGAAVGGREGWVNGIKEREGQRRRDREMAEQAKLDVEVVKQVEKETLERGYPFAQGYNSKGSPQQHNTQQQTEHTAPKPTDAGYYPEFYTNGRATPGSYGATVAQNTQVQTTSSHMGVRVSAQSSGKNKAKFGGALSSKGVSIDLHSDRHRGPEELMSRRVRAQPHQYGQQTHPQGQKSSRKSRSRNNNTSNNSPYNTATYAENGANGLQPQSGPPLRHFKIGQA